MNVREDNPDQIARTDIVVGIPSYNEAPRIAVPTQNADKGLVQYFGDLSAVIVNCDNHSPDNTREAFLETPTHNPKIYLSTPENVRGKGHNVKNLVRKAVDLDAKAVILLDADLESISPRWIRNLAEPLFDGSHYVAPLYVRHKYDGAITNNIAYPLTRALYGRRIRQPIGGEFGFSGKLAKTFLESDIWSDALSNYGIDVWMTTTAMRNRVPMIQSFMGGPRIHRAKTGVAAHLGLFQDVVATIFELMARYESFWKEVKWSRPTPVFGFGISEIEVAPPVKIDSELLWAEFSAGMESRRDLYREALQPETMDKLEEVGGLPQEIFEFPSVLWAKVLYDFACAYKAELCPRRELLTGLMPLFCAKTLSFVRETEPMNTHQVEEFIEDQCLQFEQTKPYLLEQWFSG